ncbi:hypothetical protein SNK05_13732 [Fusarium graminearum]
MLSLFRSLSTYPRPVHLSQIMIGMPVTMLLSVSITVPLNALLVGTAFITELRPSFPSLDY